jgi:hypothetical protein
MIVEMQKFMKEQTQTLAGKARKFRRNPERFVRKALADSSEGLKSLRSPVRMMAHSGVKLTVVSQNALQNLIEWQSEVVTSALSGAAVRFAHASRAEDFLDLVRDQTATLPASRDRIVEEATRGVAIVTDVGHEVRKLAAETYGKVVRAGEGERPKAKVSRPRKGKPAARKTVARGRKRVAKPVPASAWTM